MRWLRPLGSTGITVSALGLGTVKLGRNRQVKYPAAFDLPTDTAAARLLDEAWELGINLLDTAPAYGDSEARLGRLLGGRDWVLCTKVGEEFEQGRSRFDFSAEHTRLSVERSLQRLARPALDLVCIHSDGDDLAILEGSDCLATLRRLQEQGLVRSVGFSAKTLAGARAAARACDVVMLTLNTREREMEAALPELAGAGLLVKKPLGSGHLAADLAQSLAYVTPHCGAGAALVGTLSTGHLAANVAAIRATLD